MSDIKLKICGLRDNAYEVMEEIQPDFAGFIFYEQSPRYVSDMQFDETPDGTKKVGVFVNASYDQIVKKINKNKLSIVQLHGDETPELCLRLRPHAEVIKVFSGNRTINTNELKSYEPFVDYFLFDTRGKNYGGSGMAFNWQKLENLPTDKPVIISGGIGLEEAREIKQLKGVNVYGIDVNSKFEIAPGLKEITLLKKLKDTLK